MNKLKTTLVVATLFATALPLWAQRARLSPHETTSAVIGERRSGCRVTVVYGRPYTKDPRSGEMRKIWGGLVPYGKPWRMGADEATLLITQQPLVFGETTVPAGAYTLYMIPEEGDDSKLAFSTALGGWGIPVNQSHDEARVPLKKEALDNAVDQFTIAVENNPAGGGVLKLTWEKTQYSVPFTIKK
jgi:Protein of unknown function (DUF2911)